MGMFRYCVVCVVWGGGWLVSCKTSSSHNSVCLLAPGFVARRSQTYGYAPSSRLARSQNPLRTFTTDLSYRTLEHPELTVSKNVSKKLRKGTLRGDEELALVPLKARLKRVRNIEIYQRFRPSPQKRPLAEKAALASDNFKLSFGSFKNDRLIWTKRERS